MSQEPGSQGAETNTRKKLCERKQKGVGDENKQDKQQTAKGKKNNRKIRKIDRPVFSKIEQIARENGSWIAWLG